MTRILRASLLVVVRLIVGLSESRIIADFGDWKMLTAGGVSTCLSESRITRMTRITRILRVSLLVVARLIAALSESRIISDFGDWKMLTAGAVSACLSESQICADYTD